MAIIQSLPLGGSGSTYTNMTTDEAIAGTNTEERVVSAKVLNDAIDNKIPTVNNATLTIQKNGTTVKTFTANASANVTANITVPTKVSDLTNDSGFVVDVSGKADKATTLSGYGITDAYTKTQVDTKISDLVNSAPETLDTLNELAQALGNDPNFATTIAGQIGSKANDSDVVHKSGNETIGGIKTFSNTQTYFGRDVCCYSNVKYGKNLNPTTTSYQYVFFNGNTASDGAANNWYGGYLEQVINPDGQARGRWLVRDTSENTVGIELWASGDAKQVRPYQNNNTNLGDAGRKFKNVYATTLHGDVDFPITEAQIAAIVV